MKVYAKKVKAFLKLYNFLYKDEIEQYETFSIFEEFNHIDLDLKLLFL